MNEDTRKTILITLFCGVVLLLLGLPINSWYSQNRVPKATTTRDYESGYDIVLLSNPATQARRIVGIRFDPVRKRKIQPIIGAVPSETVYFKPSDFNSIERCYYKQTLDIEIEPNSNLNLKCVLIDHRDAGLSQYGTLTVFYGDPNNPSSFDPFENFEMGIEK